MGVVGQRGVEEVAREAARLHRAPLAPAAARVALVHLPVHLEPHLEHPPRAALVAAARAGQVAFDAVVGALEALCLTHVERVPREAPARVARAGARCAARLAAGRAGIAQRLRREREAASALLAKGAVASLALVAVRRAAVDPAASLRTPLALRLAPTPGADGVARAVRRRAVVLRGDEREKRHDDHDAEQGPAHDHSQAPSGLSVGGEALAQSNERPGVRFCTRGHSKPPLLRKHYQVGGGPVK